MIVWNSKLMGEHLTAQTNIKLCAGVMQGGAEHVGIGDSALRRAVNQRRRVLFSGRAAEARREELIPLTEEEWHARRQIYIHRHTRVNRLNTPVEVKHTHKNSHTLMQSQPLSLQRVSRGQGTLWKVLRLFISDISGTFLSFFGRAPTHIKMSFYPCRDSSATTFIPQPLNLKLTITMEDDLFLQLPVRGVGFSKVGFQVWVLTMSCKQIWNYFVRFRFLVLTRWTVIQVWVCIMFCKLVMTLKLPVKLFADLWIPE